MNSVVNFLVSIATVIGLLVTAWVTGRAAVRANRQAKDNKTLSEMLESRKVDKEAFEQARQIYREGIEEVRQQLVDCRAELASEKLERQREQAEIRRLTQRVAHLERDMRKAGLEIPNGVHNGGFG